MLKTSGNVTILTNKISIRPEFKGAFADWQAKFHKTIAEFPGFASLEILSSEKENKQAWTLVQRFYQAESANAWRHSSIRQELLNELKAFIDVNPIEELETKESTLTTGITEVFVTHVNPENEKAYHDWVAKIHQAEAKFPGFKSLYVQSPSQETNQTWLTLLQFDSAEHLDQWLSSPERQKILNESRSMIQSLESHRVISPYSSWFASIAKEGRRIPAWKQSMIVLLMLFPIVMLELKFLPLFIGPFNPSLVNFIGNALSVSLLTWPAVPLATKPLKWWLLPKQEDEPRTTILGTVLILALYLLEVILFWKWL